MLRFSKSLVDKFNAIPRTKEMRYGQAFHQHFGLEKVTGADKVFCDRLYVETDYKAKQMVKGRIDYQSKS